jgi:probable HAF family extracellular repeat protein
MSMTIGLALAATLVAATGTATTGPAGADRPTEHRRPVMVELLPLPSDPWALPIAMNDDGVVVGGSGGRPVRWDPDGRPTPLPTLGHHIAQVSDINDAGTVVGLAYTPTAVPHAVLWRADGTVVDLGARHGHLTSYAAAVNDRGAVVGHIGDDAVLWQPNGTVQTLPDPESAWWTTAEGLTDNGTIIGTTTLPGGVRHSIVWRGVDHRPTVLPTDTELVAVAGRGWTAGHAVEPRTTMPAATVWNPAGRVTAMGALPGAAHSWASAVNGSGTAVGSSTFADHSHRATRWNRFGAVTELSGPAGFPLVLAVAVTDDETVVGYAQGETFPVVQRALRWDRFGRPSELGTLPGTLGARPIAVNRRGMVVGIASNGVSHDRAVLWR